MEDLPHEIIKEIFDYIKDDNITNKMLSLVSTTCKKYTKGKINNRFILHESCKNGHLSIVKWTIENSCEPSLRMINTAAINGHLNIVKFLLECNCVWNHNTVSNVALYNDLDLIKYFMEKTRLDYNKNFKIKFVIKFEVTATANAALNGNIDIVKFLILPCNARYFFKNINCDTSVIYNAASNGHLNIIKYILTKSKTRSLITEKIPAIAAFNGHDEIVKFCVNNYVWDKETAINAACKGNLDIIKFLFQKKQFMSVCIPINAAIEGHLDIIKYCFENGCYWDDNILFNATKYNNVDIVKYLIDIN